MTLNYPGPYTVEIKYQVSSLTHTQRLNCDITNSPAVGDAFSTILVLQNDTLTTSLDLAVEAYLLTIVPFFNTSVQVTSVKLFKNVALSFERDYVSAYTPTTNAGTSASPTVLSDQQTYTFFTAEGGVMRTVLLETKDGGNSQLGYGALGASSQTHVDYIIGNNGWIIGRDTSRVRAFNLLSQGQNESVWRKRNRN